MSQLHIPLTQADAAHKLADTEYEEITTAAKEEVSSDKKISFFITCCSLVDCISITLCVEYEAGIN